MQTQVLLTVSKNISLLPILEKQKYDQNTSEHGAADCQYLQNMGLVNNSSMLNAYKVVPLVRDLGEKIDLTDITLLNKLPVLKGFRLSN